MSPPNPLPLLALAAIATTASAADLCATAAQREVVVTAVKPGAPVDSFGIAATLALPEPAVLDALPTERRVGTGTGQFARVWDSLVQWPDAMTVIRKAGNVLEVHGALVNGEPSKKSAFFNLAPNKGGLSGHIRPDLVAAIYAVTLPGPGFDIRGVLFFSATGEQLLAVYVPAEGGKPEPALIGRFEATRDLIAGLPPACPAPGAAAAP